MAVMTSKATLASEGAIELKATNEQNSHCFFLSVLMVNQQYSLLGTCRNLIYPPQPDALNYLLWAKPVPVNDREKRPIRLTSLESGKIETDTNVAFNELFVTVEKDKFTRSPSDQVVMKGGVGSIPSINGNQVIIPGATIELEDQPTQQVKGIFGDQAVLAVSSLPITEPVSRSPGSTVFYLVAGVGALLFLAFISFRRA